MPRRLDDVTDAELEVLKRLWLRGPSSIRQIADDLYPGGGVSHYATVQKLLDRLEAKSWVRRRSLGRVNQYAAARERKDLIARRLKETADALCEGSLTPLLTHLAGSVSLSVEELAELRDIVGRAGRNRKKAPGRT